MKFKMIFLIAFVVCVLNIGSIHSMPEDTMDTWKSRIDVNDPSWSYFSSGRLKSHSGSYYKPNMQKTLIISAPRGYSIFAAFRTIDLRPNSQDSVTLHADGQIGTGALTVTNTLSYRNKIYDSKEEKFTYFAKNGQLAVTFVTAPGYSTSGYQGFDLYYTVQADYTKCLSKNFKCKNGQCIAKALTCDGHNHCGDRSDQSNCGSFGVGKTVGIVIGVIFLIVAAACAIYIIFRRRSQPEVTTIINHPPPPAYPQPTHYPPPPPPYTTYNQGAPNPGFR